MNMHLLTKHLQIWKKNKIHVQDLGSRVGSGDVRQVEVERWWACATTDTPTLDHGDWGTMGRGVNQSRRARINAEQMRVQSGSSAATLSLSVHGSCACECLGRRRLALGLRRRRLPRATPEAIYSSGVGDWRVLGRGDGWPWRWRRGLARPRAEMTPGTGRWRWQQRLT